MKKKFFALCLMLGILFSLTGCVRYDATLKVNEDWTADIRMLYAQKGIIDNSVSEETAAEYAKAGISLEEYLEDDYAGHIFRKNGLRVETKKNEVSGADNFLAGMQAEVFTVDGKHVTVSFVPLPEEVADTESHKLRYLEDDGGYARFHLELPVKPTKHNAMTVSDDGKTLTWDIAAMGPHDVVYAEFDMPTDKPSGRSPVWIIIAAAAAVLAVIAAVVIVKKKKSAAAGATPVEDAAPAEEKPNEADGE